MLRTRENSDVFNSLDEIYLVFTSKKQISSIYWIVFVNVRLVIFYEIIDNTTNSPKITKTRPCNTQVFLKLQELKISVYIFLDIFFLFLLQNIDCGYWVYNLCFEAKIKKKKYMYTPAHPIFAILDK